MADTAAPSPSVSAAPSVRGDPAPASSAGPSGLVIPEGMVVVWDDTLKQFVVKDSNDVRPKVRTIIILPSLYVFQRQEYEERFLVQKPRKENMKRVPWGNEMMRGVDSTRGGVDSEAEASAS